MSNSTPEPRTHRPGHLVQRIDALPPWADEAGRRYTCPTCGFLTHDQVIATLEIHEIAELGRLITEADLEPGEPIEGWS